MRIKFTKDWTWTINKRGDSQNFKAGAEASVTKACAEAAMAAGAACAASQQSTKRDQDHDRKTADTGWDGLDCGDLPGDGGDLSGTGQDDGQPPDDGQGLSSGTDNAAADEKSGRFGLGRMIKKGG